MVNRGRTEAEMPSTLARDHTPSPVRDVTRRVLQLDSPSGRGDVAAPPSLATGNASRPTEAQQPSPQMIALGELERVRIFLIFVYLAG